MLQKRGSGTFDEWSKWLEIHLDAAHHKKDNLDDFIGLTGMFVFVQVYFLLTRELFL